MQSLEISIFPFSAATLLVWQQERYPASKIFGVGLAAVVTTISTTYCSNEVQNGDSSGTV